MHPTALWASLQWTSFDLAVQGVVTFAVLVVLAALIHRFVEKPAAALRRRLSAVAKAA